MAPATALPAFKIFEKLKVEKFNKCLLNERIVNIKD